MGIYVWIEEDASDAVDINNDKAVAELVKPFIDRDWLIQEDAKVSDENEQVWKKTTDELLDDILETRPAYQMVEEYGQVDDYFAMVVTVGNEYQYQQARNRWE